MLFLSPARKKKRPKRKEHSCTSGTTSDDSRAKRQELATLRQPVLLYAWKPPSASRPYCEAGPAYGKEPPSTNIDVGLAKVPVYAAKVDVYDAKVDVYKFSSTILPSRLHTKHKTLNSNRMKWNEMYFTRLSQLQEGKLLVSLQAIDTQLLVVKFHWKNFFHSVWKEEESRKTSFTVTYKVTVSAHLSRNVK